MCQILRKTSRPFASIFEANACFTYTGMDDDLTQILLSICNTIDLLYASSMQELLKLKLVQNSFQQFTRLGFDDSF